MCGESIAPIDTDYDCYGLVEATLDGGYDSPALRDMSTYKLTLCEYCLDHIFQQCVNPPKAFEFSFRKYEPIEEQMKDEKYKRGELYEHHEKILEEKRRRDALRANAPPYKSTSKEMLDYEKSFYAFGNPESAPTKEYQDKMKALRDESVRLFNLLSEEEKAEEIYHNNSYPYGDKLPPEQWHDWHVPSDEDLVSQETHDEYKAFANLVNSEYEIQNKPDFKLKKEELNKKIKEAFDNLSGEAKKLSKSLYNIVFEVKDPQEEEMWKKVEENIIRNEAFLLFPRPEYPKE